MPLYEIEQYEVHALTYRVDAGNRADAIRKLLDGEATPVENSLDLIGICDTKGLAVSEEADLVAELERLQVPIAGTVIPSIRSIREFAAE